MTLERQRLLLFIAVAIGLIAATVLTLRNGDGGTDAVRGFLGPTPGPAATAEDYITAKRAELAKLARTEPSRDAAALVSFERYISAPGAQNIARGLDASFVFVRFPTSEATPLEIETTIAGAVADAASDLRKQVQREIDALVDRMEAAQGAERAEVNTLLTQRRADYAKIDADCGCVFAVAVEGAEVRELQNLQGQRFVRLVDVPDPLVSELDGWELAPLVPRGS